MIQKLSPIASKVLANWTSWNSGNIDQVLSGIEKGESNRLSTAYLMDKLGISESTDDAENAAFRKASFELMSWGQINRAAILIALHSALEQTLAFTCRIEMEIRGVIFKPGDLRGEGLGKWKMCLKRLVGLDYGSIPSHQDIAELSCMRNVLVHTNGTLHLAKHDLAQKIRQYASRDDGVILLGDEVVVTETRYLRKMKSASDKFLEGLHDRYAHG